MLDQVKQKPCKDLFHTSSFIFLYFSYDNKKLKYFYYILYCWLDLETIEQILSHIWQQSKLFIYSTVLAGIQIKIKEKTGWIKT